MEFDPRGARLHQFFCKPLILNGFLLCVAKVRKWSIEVVHVLHRMQHPIRPQVCQPYRSRHGIWYVRCIVPADLRMRFPVLPKALKRSTKTSEARFTDSGHDTGVQALCSTKRIQPSQDDKSIGFLRCRTVCRPLHQRTRSTTGGNCLGRALPQVVR